MSIPVALLGTSAGAAAAVAALYIEVRRRRLGDPTASAKEILKEAIGMPAMQSHDSVERQLVIRASAVAFPLFVIITSVLAATVVGTTVTGVLLGLAGFLFGLCCLGAGRRYR